MEGMVRAMNATPGICLGRYDRHTLVWTDKDGVSRCRRCHAEWTPGPPHVGKTSGRDRINRRKAARDRFIPKKPVMPAHNPDCPHPPPFTDPMEAHLFAATCMSLGIEQRECSVCHQWVWESLFNAPQEGQSLPPHLPGDASEGQNHVETPQIAPAASQP